MTRRTETRSSLALIVAVVLTYATVGVVLFVLGYLIGRILL